MDFEAIKARARCNVEAREIVSLGQTLRIKKLSINERDSLSAELIGPDGKVDPRRMVGYRPRLVSLCWVDDKGQPVTTAEELGSWAPEVIEEIHAACEAVNSLSPVAVETAAKNS